MTTMLASGSAHHEAVGLVSDGLMTIAEAAAFLHVSRSTLYALMEQGRLPYARIGRARRIPKKAVTILAAVNLVGYGGVRASG